MPPKQLYEQPSQHELALLHPIHWVQEKLGHIAAGLGIQKIEMPVGEIVPVSEAQPTSPQVPEMARALRRGRPSK